MSDVLLIAGYSRDRGSVIGSMNHYAEIVYQAYASNGFLVNKILLKEWINFINPRFVRYERMFLIYIIYPMIMVYYAQKYKRIHITDHSVIGVAILIAVLYPNKLVISIHDDVWLSELKESWFLSRALFKVVQKIYFSASKVYYLTQVAQRNIESVFAGVAKESVVSLLPIRKLPKPTADLNLQVEDNHVVILHVGSNAKYKNRRVIVSLAREIAELGNAVNFRFILAGDPISTFESSATSIPSNIINIVSPNDEVLSTLYSRANIFLFTSLNEGFGWPPLEAQTFGKPIIASDIPLFHETLGQSAYYIQSVTQIGSQEFVDLVELIKREFDVRICQLNLNRFSLERFILCFGK